jgi:hypothetical protein
MTSRYRIGSDFKKSSQILVISVNSGRLFLVFRLGDSTESVRIVVHKGDGWLSWSEMDGY